jgi:Glycosyl transferase family 2
MLSGPFAGGRDHAALGTRTSVTPDDQRSTSPEFTVVVPVFNSMPWLTQCTDALRAASAQHDSHVEVVIIDNGSDDESYKYLVATYGSLWRIEQFAKRNISAVRNYGASLAHGRYLCFLDSDVVICRDYFANVRDVIAAHGADATGCEVTVPEDGGWIETTWAGLHRPPHDGLTHYLNSANFVVSAEAFRTIGGFDERLTTGEDAEIGQRLRSHGFLIFQARSVAAVHLRNPKTLLAFFRRQMWHGLGMLGTVNTAAIDRPVVMTALHAVSFAVALAILALGNWPVAGRLMVAVATTLAAPLAAVIYRYMAAGFQGARPLRALALYHIYFDARIVAVLRIISDKAKAVAFDANPEVASSGTDSPH